ncbi:MAG TPA: hypothetical protein VKS24_04935 [Bradyrhizobium sp.]|nr:hypothetical protein [Bradyrhizobium sp.]
MPGRLAKFVSAIFASILAGTSLTTISHSETAAADHCLSAPDGDAPQGSHWYYHIERSTNRHCWYLREGGERLSQAPQNILPPAKPPAPQAEPASQRALANARAELSQPNRNDGPNAAPPMAAATPNAAPRASVFDANPSPATVASRWPEPSVSPPSGPRPATSSLAASTPTDPVAAPAPAAAAVALATADSSSHRQRETSPTLLAVIVGSLMLAGIAGMLITRFGRARRSRRPPVRARRGPVWERTDDDRIVLSDHRSAPPLVRQPRFASGGTKARNSNDQVSEFYARISRGARR